MKLQLIHFTCDRCGRRFKAPGNPVGSYGEFLLRSVGGSELRSLDALGERTFQEVNDLLRSSLDASRRDPRAAAKVLHRIYGEVACDPDANGHLFQIGQAPLCPFCGAQKTSHWEATEPPELVEIEVPQVTHNNWSHLSLDEKKARVVVALQSLGD